MIRTRRGTAEQEREEEEVRRSLDREDEEDIECPDNEQLLLLSVVICSAKRNTAVIQITWNVLESVNVCFVYSGEQT